MYLSALRTCDEMHIVCLVDDSIEFACSLVFCFGIADEMYELIDSHERL